MLFFKPSIAEKCDDAQVIIAGAGGAAHLPGMVAAMTPLPVIGVPVKPRGAHLDGLDALLSIVQVASAQLYLHSHINHKQMHIVAGDSQQLSR